ARLFMLTDAGHAAGPTSYDDVAIQALRYLAQTGGEAAVRAFAEQRVSAAEQRYAELVQAAPEADRAADLEARYAHVASAEDRPAALAAALSADGYAATTHPQGTGIQLCQHHCPVQHVATEFPQLCEAETAALGRLLDVHVQRLATIAHGDGVCTTFIPASTGKASP
ncbi:MAG: hypothetical protein ABIO67_02945, partial [Mycobacteriales bacterium]